ncbi:hypothetical protein OVA24_16800 [Luteolibacter sp. SL250]|uniref:hypothetical protein n=1 Tax=Luteolibacter sp. SL250 TaxID=2995170 RepID=UPI002271BEBA|nr:hypothetical protein [Luteolibacter sp. SL250]WAC18892.1 hypothetical protein OVA24_16800 [Luteolibacter sp. SL250]
MKTRAFLFTTLLLSLLPAARAASLYVDFGPNATVADSITWNTVNSFSTGVKVADLQTTTGQSTGYGLNLTTNALVSDVNDGPTTLTPTANYRDGYYGALNGTPNNPTVFTLTGLDPAITYTFSFFATVDRTGTRGTRYTVGDPGNYAELEANDNVNTWSTPISATPDTSGNLTVTLSRASFNADQSYIINVMKVDFVPEPSAALLSAAGLIPLLSRRRR